MRGGNSPLLVTDNVPPVGLWSGWICETLTDNPFIKPVKQGWQMRLPIPKMPTIFKAMGEWRSRQRIAPPGRLKVQAASGCIILKFWGETEFNLMASWLNDSDRDYIVSVSGFYEAVKWSQNIFTEMLINLKEDLVTMLHVLWWGNDYLTIGMNLIINLF